MEVTQGQRQFTGTTSFDSYALANDERIRMATEAQNPAASVREEFDLLMQRAQLTLAPSWREAMLTEFGQMRTELEAIRRYAGTRKAEVEPRLPITLGRRER